jgi:two-component system, NtrC family, sensor kinase
MLTWLTVTPSRLTSEGIPYVGCDTISGWREVIWSEGKVFRLDADIALTSHVRRLQRPGVALFATRLNTKPYVGRFGVAVLACLVATQVQAQSLAGGYSDVVGLGAMGGIIVVLLAWTQSLRRQLRRVGHSAAARSVAPAAPAEAKPEMLWEDEHEILNTLLEYASDQIYFKDRQSRFRWCCKAVCDRFGVTQAEIVGKSDFDFFDEAHARPAFEDEQEIMRTGKAFHGKIEKEVMKDGKVLWALSSKIPLRNKADEIVGTFGLSKDVTFLKEAEAKLEGAHKQLVESSRVAGMAEVATTVLHNVGNVLNSVNISASLVADRIKNSKALHLTRAAEMLQEHSADLANFLTSDPKGSKLPSYFATLSESLMVEHDDILQELSSLCANIEHIKEIVAMQQAYAKVAGLQETLKPADLIEDALRLNAGAVERHHVQVIREFSETQRILVDKHKVLQILVNLMRNAKYALENRDPGDKRMILRAEAGENQTVKISVIDNGVGIAPENMTRIFEHGFTTRQNGHGFALHSGALAAREMGGSLTGHSEGPGKGATFILELPLRPPETSA